MLTEHRTLRDIAVLMGVGLVAWGYLAATTVMISEDGVSYIERAQKVWSEPEAIFNLREPPGLPLLISGVHGVLCRFGADGLYTWITAGQLATLACSLAAIASLYFLGRALLDGRSAFWGVLILTLLPYPAHFAADILRDWPHLLFLSTGLLLLYRAMQEEKGTLFFLAGLSAGLGYVIRPECTQLLFYGCVFFVIEFVRVLRHRRPAGRIWHYGWMAAGFLLIFLPVASQLENVIPHKLDYLFEPGRQVSLESPVPRATAPQTAAMGIGGFGRAVIDLGEGLGENLFYFFTVPAAIGFWLLFFKERPETRKRVLIGLFVGFYAAALCILYMRWGYISRRHVLPLTALACFYIPAGAEWLGKQLNRKNARAGFYCIVAAGLAVCAAKLVKPLGYEKKCYFEAIGWLSQNTAADDVLYTFDRRIPFYAERRYQAYRRLRFNRPELKFDYVIALDNDARLSRIPVSMKLEKSFTLEREQKILIYKETGH